MTTKPLWINLGCADDILEGYLNVDLPEYDLRKDWIWADNSVDHILAKDIIEHLPDKIHTMNEAHRVLKPGGIMQIEVPTTDGCGAFQDPTHVSYWNRRSFMYFEKDCVYRDRFAKSYGITCSFITRHAEIQSTVDGPRLLIILEAYK